jgi:hypothetical protein
MTHKAVYFAIIAVVFIGIYAGQAITIPVTPLPWVRDAYLAVEATPDGGYVWIEHTEGPVTMSAGFAVWEAVITQCWRKHLKLVAYGNTVESAEMMRRILEFSYGSPLNAHPLYGTELVYIGFVPGGRALVVRNMAEDFTLLKDTDAYGTPLKDLPLIQEFPRAKDCDLVLTGHDAFQPVYMVAPDKPIVLLRGDTGAMASPAPQYYNAGLIKGLVKGATQAAMYAQLVGIPSSATVFLFTEVLTALIMILGTIVLSVAYVMERGVSGGSKES